MSKLRIGEKGQPFFELSPFYQESFSLDGVYWKSLVHYWVAMSVSGDSLRNNIRRQDTPQKALNLARRNGFQDFDETDPKYILRGLDARYTQSSHIKIVLLSTGIEELIYGSGNNFLSKNNRYGKILMRLRDKYNGAEQYT